MYAESIAQPLEAATFYHLMITISFDEKGYANLVTYRKFLQFSSLIPHAESLSTELRKLLYCLVNHSSLSVPIMSEDMCTS